jgi:hypothetical protein
MKKILNYIAAAALAMALLAGCAKDEENFDASQIVGEWSFEHDYGQGLEEIHHVFNADGTGYDKYITNGAPNQNFKWTLEGNRLTFDNQLTRLVFKDCTVTTLNDIKLVYEENTTGDVFDCTRVHNVE